MQSNACTPLIHDHNACFSIEAIQALRMIDSMASARGVVTISATVNYINSAALFSLICRAADAISY